MEEDSSSLRDDLAEWLVFLEPMLSNAKSYRWDGDDASQFWEFLRRGIIIRQQEALQSALKMVEGGYGHFAVTFLRPAYEELIWMEYLQANVSSVPDLPLLIGRYEVGSSLSAQNENLGKSQMATIGFSQKFVKKFAATSRHTEARIREIGRILGWPRRNQAVLPSMWFLSRKVGRENDYKYLYHATSRFVHFSAQEVYRRVWGVKGSVQITSTSFSRYWQDFAMYWGFRIFMELMIPCGDLLQDRDVSDEAHQRMLRLLGRFHPIPIVTVGELESWDRAPD